MNQISNDWELQGNFMRNENRQTTRGQEQYVVQKYMHNPQNTNNYIHDHQEQFISHRVDVTQRQARLLKQAYPQYEHHIIRPPTQYKDTLSTIQYTPQDMNVAKNLANLRQTNPPEFQRAVTQATVAQRHALTIGTTAPPRQDQIEASRRMHEAGLLGPYSKVSTPTIPTFTNYAEQDRFYIRWKQTGVRPDLLERFLARTRTDPNTSLLFADGYTEEPDYIVDYEKTGTDPGSIHQLKPVYRPLCKLTPRETSIFEDPTSVPKHLTDHLTKILARENDNLIKDPLTAGQHTLLMGNTTRIAECQIYSLRFIQSLLTENRILLEYVQRPPQWNQQQATAFCATQESQSITNVTTYANLCKRLHMSMGQIAEHLLKNPSNNATCLKTYKNLLQVKWPLKTQGNILEQQHNQLIGQRDDQTQPMNQSQKTILTTMLKKDRAFSQKYTPYAPQNENGKKPIGPGG